MKNSVIKVKVNFKIGCHALEILPWTARKMRNCWNAELRFLSDFFLAQKFKYLLKPKQAPLGVSKNFGKVHQNLPKRFGTLCRKSSWGQPALPDWILRKEPKNLKWSRLEFVWILIWEEENKREKERSKKEEWIRVVLILKSVRNQAHPRGELLSTICVVIAEFFLVFSW